MFRCGFQSAVGGLLIDILEGDSGKFLPQFDKFLTVKFAQAAADGCFRPAGGDNINPAGRRGLPLSRDDLHRLPIAQARPERHANTINLRRDTGRADACMDGIGKINGRSATRQFDDIAFG